MEEEQIPHTADKTALRDDVLTKVAMASIVEQRRSRRWGILWKALTFTYATLFIFILAGIAMQDDSSVHTVGKGGKHTAVVDLYGMISANSYANADITIEGLRNAFEHKNTEAVILRINSPGGSSVQSGQIYMEMQRLRDVYPNIPLYAVIEDIGASGGYYVAAGADKIYADKSSLVGSIGVIMSGFGFVDAMEKLGIERRVMTAGVNKALFDSFSPESSAAKQHINLMLGEVHQQFISSVKKGRGDRLKEQPDLFSGLIWTGEKSVELGLVDALGDVRSVARDVVGEEDLVNFTPKPDFLENFAERLGTSFSAALLTRVKSGAFE